MPVIKGYRGLGLMLALELKVPSKQVMIACLGGRIDCQCGHRDGDPDLTGLKYPRG